MNYIITKHKEFFEKIGEYNYCNLEDMILPDTIAYDSETTGLAARHNDIFCIQIGTGENNYIIHMYDDNYSFFDAIPYLQDKILIGHNILFDLGFMYKYAFYPKEVRDTMLASKILYNGDVENIRNDFGTVMKRELGVQYDKTNQKNIHIVKLSQPSTILYSFNDVDRLIELHDTMLSKIAKSGFELTYELHCRYIRALSYMEQCGLPISPNLWKAKMIEDVKATLLWKGIIEEYIYDNISQFRDRQIDIFNNDKKILISIQSPKQMIRVFNSLDIPTLDKDGKDSINENIISKSKHEFIDMWLAFQKANHRVTTFGESVYKQIENNRIYTNFNPMVDTARLSTRKGNINFLNFPSDKITRSCFVANKGNVMIVCDWSGQETVIAADLSGDEAMTKSVVEGADLHSLLARVLFPELAEMTDEEIMTKHKDKRTASKAPRFAMSYGGNAYTLHMNEGIPMERAVEIEVGFKDLHAGLYAWGDIVFRQSVSTGYIKSADGWRLKLPKYEMYLRLEKIIKSISSDQWQMYRAGKIEYKRKKDDKEYKIKSVRNVEYYGSKARDVSRFFKLKSEYKRLCLNNPVQTTGSHQLKLAKTLLFDWIIENNYQNIVLIDNSVHDEIVAECPKHLGELVKNKIQECMIIGGNHYLNTLTIKADAHIGNSWYAAK